MTADPRPALLIRNEFELRDLIDREDRPAEMIERDFALMVITTKKLELVRQGDKQARITANLASMEVGYDAAVEGVAPDAPSFTAARELLLKRLPALLP